jgi:uncharacterized membrane protein
MLEKPNLEYRFLLARAWTAFRERPFWAVLSFLWVALLNASVNHDPSQPATPWQIAFLVFLSGPLQVGLLRVYLRLVRSEKPGIEDVFFGFRHWVLSSTVFVSFNLAVAVGLLLFIVPAVFILVAFFPALYLVADCPSSFKQTFTTAWKLTEGLRWELFGIVGIFVLLIIAGVLAFGVGIFFTLPLAMLLTAATYEEISLSRRHDNF